METTVDLELTPGPEMSGLAFNSAGSLKQSGVILLGNLKQMSVKTVPGLFVYNT